MLKQAAEKLVSEYKKRIQNNCQVVEMDNSNIRVIFNSDFQVNSILGTREFAAVRLPLSGAERTWRNFVKDEEVAKETKLKDKLSLLFKKKEYASKFANDAQVMGLKPELD